MKKKLLKLIDLIGIQLSGLYLRYKSASKGESKYLNERVQEMCFVFEVLSENPANIILDVGSGNNAFAATLEHCRYDVTASDLKGEYWGFLKSSNRHIYVVKDDICKSQHPSSSFDVITCISTLEHIVDFDSAVAEMSRLLKKGGVMILSFPYFYDEFCENVYALETADELSKRFRYIARSYSDKQLDDWCSANNLEIIRERFIRGWEGKFWRSGERISYPEVVDKNAANYICVAFRKS